MFKCDRCGECCRNISLSAIYSELDRGDGICKFFDERTSSCSIYENRPIICNVDLMYKFYFSRKMSIDEFYELNYEACHKLKTLKLKKHSN